MDAMAAARREAGREIELLAAEFEASDQSAFRIARILCWVLCGATTAIMVVLWLANVDIRYLLVTWLVIVALVWGLYALSRWRQRRQTAKLRELADRWVKGAPAT